MEFPFRGIQMAPPLPSMPSLQLLLVATSTFCAGPFHETSGGSGGHGSEAELTASLWSNKHGGTTTLRASCWAPQRRTCHLWMGSSTLGVRQARRGGCRWSFRLEGPYSHSTSSVRVYELVVQTPCYYPRLPSGCYSWLLPPSVLNSDAFSSLLHVLICL